MIVVRVKRLLLIFLAILASFLIFLMISVKLFSEDPLNMSIEKQQIVFWGIIVFIFQILVFLTVFIDHRKLVFDLKRLAGYKDLNHPQSVKILDQLNEIGRVIKTMFYDFNTLLELRLNRITAFNKVLKIVCEEYPDPLIISDTLGSILGMSRKLSDKLDPTKSINIKLNDIFPDIKLAEILVSLEKNHDIWKEDSDTGYTCTPVFDNGGNLNLCIWEFETSNFYQKLSNNPVTSISRKSLNTFKGLRLKRKKTDK